MAQDLISFAFFDSAICWLELQKGEIFQFKVCLLLCCGFEGKFRKYLETKIKVGENWNNSSRGRSHELGDRSWHHAVWAPSKKE